MSQRLFAIPFSSHLLYCTCLVPKYGQTVPFPPVTAAPASRAAGRQQQRRRDVKRHVAKYSPQLGPVLDSILELQIPALYLVVYARSPVELTPIISALADLLSTDRLNLGCLLQPTHTISFERLRRSHMHLAEAI
ncbi:hypothetical protein CABS01_00513 [Colletotrichum abscissum]|uniref:uncharacterized protein n=1 Tax=Colletotrichum abscissum TaxID=1671311 RepID=UPI0027D4EEA5|nr:uncharacterized protein CABS01_00513 [Colletotrichum abscissum]KAK1525424.1 hypothetical protein CABS01_00513 [Colletotrichum abscissum]